MTPESFDLDSTSSPLNQKYNNKAQSRTVLNPHELIDSVVNVTKHRNKTSFQEGLVKTMSDLLCADEIAIHKLLDGKGRPVMHELIYYDTDLAEEKKTQGIANPCIGCEHVINTCIGSGHIYCDKGLQNEKQRVLFPIAINNIDFSVITIVTHKISKQELSLIKGVVSIYENVLAIFRESETDTLTGLLNRKTFDNQISSILSLYDKVNDPINWDLESHSERRGKLKEGNHWIGVMDIDFFKRINDNFGHLYGDEVLLLFAKIMQECFREQDLLFRYGGEEFVVVLAPTEIDHAMQAFNRFREMVESYDFPQVGRVTVSIGVSIISQGDIASLVIEHADQALYYAKENGRNQVCSYESLLACGQLAAEPKEKIDIDFF